MFLTFSLLRKGTRRTAAGTHPHFLFETSKRKPSRGASLAPSGQFTFCAVHGGKEKMSGMIWHLRVKLPKTEVGRHALPTKSGSLLPAALYSFFPEPPPRICRHREQWGTKPNRRISAPVRSASLRTTRFGSCFILLSPSPWERVSKGGALPRLSSPWEGLPKGKAPKRRRGRIKRGAFEEMARLAAHQGRESYSHDGVRAEARPFVPRGGMGDGWRPPCFGWGSKGEGPLRQRPLPLALTWECPLA